ncbi:MAG: MMPL family transporter [Azospirillum sp.]|nr:MMPL family transporter [Azospirillum sp.]
MPLDKLVIRATTLVVELSRRFAWGVVVAGLGIAALLGWYASERIGMNTDLDSLLSADLPWRKAEAKFDAAFPQFNGLLAVVIDGVTPDLAADAASALAERLAARPDLFHSVRRPDGDEFFLRNGLLFLSVEELSETTRQMIEAQPFIGALAADPSLRGLFGTINLALQGVARGEADFTMLEKPLANIADSVAGALRGQWRPLSWQTMLTGRTPSVLELRRFILVQPVVDFGELGRAEAAQQAIRDVVADLELGPAHGVRVRLTGPVAVESEELKTLSNGAAFSLGLSFSLVSLLLFLGLKSWRLILPIVITLLAGLTVTAAFAALTVHNLNPISVAFAVLFLGMGVDFGIQFATRFREERFLNADPVIAMRRTAEGIGGSLLLAALTTAVGFLAFLPTSYVGVSQLGLIAGGGMFIALGLNLTLLPALLTLFRPTPEAKSVGYAWAAPVDRFVIRHRRGIKNAALGVAVCGVLLAPDLRFDFNPMNLRDPNTESVATALDLMDSPDTTPFTIDILAPSPEAARALAKRLEALPEVHRALSVYSFVPDQQERKLAILDDANLLLGPTLNPVAVKPPPNAAEIRETLRDSVEAMTAPDSNPTARRLGTLLGQALERDDATLARLGAILMNGLTERLGELRAALTASAISLETMPDSVKRDWIAPDGEARIEVAPSGDARNNTTLVALVSAVRDLAPLATGSAVTIQESAETVVGAFLEAGAIAVAAIVVILFFALRRWRDVFLVLAPLLLAALMTVITCVIVGPPINFANIIALPLLLGIGVAFNIYFVINWRSGLINPLQSSTARAVLFSALTTTVAFGSLALSDHPGTASMGILLTISLGYTLATTLLALPAMLGSWRRSRPFHIRRGRRMLRPKLPTPDATS